MERITARCTWLTSYTESSSDSKPLLGVKKPANRPRLVPEKGSPKRTHKEQGNLEDKTSVIHSVQQRKKDITGKTRRLELKKVHLFFLSMVAASTACIP
jgi:hypothetical protein